MARNIAVVAFLLCAFVLVIAAARGWLDSPLQDAGADDDGPVSRVHTVAPHEPAEQESEADGRDRRNSPERDAQPSGVRAPSPVIIDHTAGGAQRVYLRPTPGPAGDKVYFATSNRGGGLPVNCPVEVDDSTCDATKVLGFEFGSYYLKGGQDYQATVDEPFSLTGSGGAPVLVNHAASWCGPCGQELPELMKLSVDLRRVVGPQVRVELLMSGAQTNASSLVSAVMALVKRAPDSGVSLPRWWRVRSDPVKAMAGFTSAFLGHNTLPTTLLFDGKCGHLAMSVSGALNEDAKHRLMTKAREINALAYRCTPAEQADAARPRSEERGSGRGSGRRRGSGRGGSPTPENPF